MEVVKRNSETDNPKRARIEKSVKGLSREICLAKAFDSLFWLPGFSNASNYSQIYTASNKVSCTFGSINATFDSLLN